MEVFRFYHITYKKDEFVKNESMMKFISVFKIYEGPINHMLLLLKQVLMRYNVCNATINGYKLLEISIKSILYRVK